MIDHRDEPYGEWSRWDTFVVVAAAGAFLLCVAVAWLERVRP